MKRLVEAAGLALVVGIVAAGSAADAQPAARGATFQSQLSALRGKIITMCAQLQAGKPARNPAQLLAEIDAIIAGWKELTGTWKAAPPAEYANDPAWPGYFGEALDNFEIMRARVEQGNYKRAMQFCGMNCQLFVTMNLVSGVDKASDRMFTVRKNAKTMMEMVSAGNWKGAERLRQQTDEAVAAMAAAVPPAGSDKAAFQQDMEAIKAVYEAFTGAIAKKDAKEAAETFSAFMKAFALVYPKYV